MSDVRLPIGGALVTVVPCHATNRRKLQTILEEYGLSDLMPEPTTPKAALRSAMVENFPSPNSKVRHGCFPHRNGSEGYKIGSHAPTDNVQVAERFCEAVAIATLRMRYLEPKEGKKKIETEWTGEIKLDPWDGDKEAAILAHMKHVTDYVPSGKLRETVTAIIEHFGGRRLIEDQPLLWLTADAIPQFRRIKTEIENASAEHDSLGLPVPPTRIGVFSVVADEEMAREVITMLMGMVDRETVRVEARLAQPSLSTEQATNDIFKALEVQEELVRYETLLEQPLTDLKQKTQHLLESIANRSMDRASMSI
jgi:hypothetical protein